MTEKNSQEPDKHYESLINIQHEQLIALRQENHELRLKISHDKQQEKEYHEKFEHLLELVNDASIRLNEGSELIKKLQQHLKIGQEKVIGSSSEQSFLIDSKYFQAIN